MWGEIGAVGGIVGSLLQFQNSEAARGMAAKERQQLNALLEKIQTPTAEQDFDFSQITPEEYSVVEKYVPQIAPRIAEQAPQVIQETADMARGRSAQMSALERLSGISKMQSDPQLAQALSEASRKATADAQSRMASSMTDAQRRGIFGSGLSQALGQQGALEGMNRSALAGQDAAAKAYENRLSAMRQSATLGGDIRNQDISLQGRNADIINAFNQRTANAAQKYGQYAADEQNQAAMRNIAANQDVSNKNVGLRNTAADEMRSRDERLRKYRNDMAQQAYQNKMGQWNAMAGQSGAKIDDLYRGAADRNQALQGVADIGMGYAGMQNANQASERQAAREDDRTFMKTHGRWMNEDERKDYQQNWSYDE